MKPQTPTPRLCKQPLWQSLQDILYSPTPIKTIRRPLWNHLNSCKESACTLCADLRVQFHVSTCRGLPRSLIPVVSPASLLPPPSIAIVSLLNVANRLPSLSVYILTYLFSAPDRHATLDTRILSDHFILFHFHKWHPVPITDEGVARQLAWTDGASRVAFACTQFLRLFRGRLHTLTREELAEFRILRRRCRKMMYVIQCYASSAEFVSMYVEYPYIHLAIQPPA